MDSNRESRRTGTEIRGGGGAQGRWKEGRSAPPTLGLRRGECRRGGVGRIAGPYGVSHTDYEELPGLPSLSLAVRPLALDASPAH